MSDETNETNDRHGDEMDDLDRALFALPLAEPPAGLRAEILRSTIYAPVGATAALGRTEIVVVGFVLALAAWLGLACFTDRAFAVGLSAIVLDVVAGLTQPTTVLSLGLGGAVALAFTLGYVPRFRSPFAGGRTS